VILLACGTQEPFDRLVRAMDQWVAAHGTPVFGQLGQLAAESYRPSHFPWAGLLAAPEFEARFAAAPLIVAHAGMGSIIGALSVAKPIVIMPRKAALGEHRNDHQLATVAKFRNRQGVFVADDETMLEATIARALAADAAGEAIPPHASPDLLETLSAFIWEGRERLQ
jgi:UDP-N-acetylglucosamine transferase subunit ALG13